MFRVGVGGPRSRLSRSLMYDPVRVSACSELVAPPVRGGMAVQVLWLYGTSVVRRWIWQQGRVGN